MIWRKKTPKFWMIVIFFFLSIASLVSVLQGVKNGLKLSQDFGARWITARVILQNENPYQMKLYDKLSDGVKELSKNKRVFFNPQYLPSSILFIFPYSLMSFNNAVKAWIITNIIASGLLVYIISLIAKTKTTYKNYFLISLIFVCGTPFRVVLGNGQLSLVALTFFALSLYFMKTKKGVLSGLFLALSLLKYNLILPFILVFFILAKRWLPLIICSFIHCISHLWFCFLMKASPFLIVFDILKLNSKELEVKGYGLRSFLNRLNELINFGPTFYYLMAFSFLFMFILLIILWIKRRKDLDDIGWLSFMGIFTLLLPYHRIYDFVCLIFSLFWITIFKEFKVLRLLVGIGICYFFFIQRILWKIHIRGYANLENIDSFSGFIFLCIMFYNTARLLYLKNKLKSI